MNLKITEIRNSGVIEEERIVLKALTDLDIGRFGIFRTGTNEKGITNLIYNAYWFPDQQLRAGDLAVLYTKRGVSSNVKNDDGSTTYFYYWGASGPLWNGTQGSVLVAIPTWSVYQR